MLSIRAEFRKDVHSTVFNDKVKEVENTSIYHN